MKRKKITAFAICSLMMFFAITTAYAATSTAYVDYGVTSYRQGPKVTLSTADVHATIDSIYATGESYEKLEGKMWTKGIIFAVLRDVGTVAPGAGNTYLYWSNPNQETGTHFSEARAQYGNHTGYCRTYQ